jgi:hypothetical protein
MDREPMMVEDRPPPAGLVLSTEEMQAAARPHTAPADVARWFRENGFTFKTSSDGYPVISRQHFEETMGSHGGRLRRSFKPIELSGKDYFSRKEAAHYCCVSESQFERHASSYGLQPLHFMGKLIYRRTDCQQAIERGWEQWAPRSWHRRARLENATESAAETSIAQFISESRRKNALRTKGLSEADNPKRRKP